MPDQDPNAEAQSAAPNANAVVQSIQEPTGIKGKKADEPHHYTVWLSIGALCVSLLSLGVTIINYGEAHQSRIINEAASRPMIQVTSVRLTDNWSGDDIISLDVTVTNFGKIAADTVVVDAEPAMIFRENNTDSNESGTTLRQQNFGIHVLRWPRAVTLEVDEMGPGRTITHPHQRWAFMGEAHRANLESGAKPVPARFSALRVTGTLKYVDQLTGRSVSGPWCYFGDAPSEETVPKGELIPCAMGGNIQ